MATFLAIAIGFPTIVFTIGLSLSLCYWALVMVGALDLDLFDFDFDFDGDVEVDLEVDASAEAIDAAGGASFVGDVLSFLGLGKVPLMVLVSFFFFFGWILSFFSTWALGPLGATALLAIAIDVAVLGASAVVALLLGSFAARPLAPIFQTNHGRENKGLIGETVVLTTGRIDGQFGQAQVQVTDSDLLVQVRCDQDNSMARNDRALIVSFDGSRDAFIVEPITKGE